MILNRAEFDQFADEYYSHHARNISLTGESPEYFSEYKIKDIYAECIYNSIDVSNVIDFGSGIGNSIPFFRKYFADADLHCADVSSRSIEIASDRYPGKEKYLLVGERSIPAEDDTYDIAFSACVFHHIDHAEHARWMAELRRVVRPGGALFIFEHNPFNPLTVRAVNTCPFDVNARLIAPGRFRDTAAAAGWKDIALRYRIYFPHALRVLRPMERYLTRVPLGAQYYLMART